MNLHKVQIFLIRLGIAALAALTATICPAQDRNVSRASDLRAEDFFERKIRPVLVEHCLKCHSVEAEKSKKLKAGLYLDSAAGMRAGGDSGPILAPGKPAESLILKTLRYDGDIRMPPKGKLPDAVTADFEEWIRLGAPDPRAALEGSKKKARGLSIEEGKSFWAYRQPVQSELPAPVDGSWARVDIDSFILQKLEMNGLRPTPPANRAVLARRVFLDLIGLPPSAEETEAFVVDGRPDAYERLVDRLLDSPHFGERWGRHWLDIARFGESLTLRGFVLKEAWRYRDYVISSINEDVPFDQMIREQIAGDLLPASSLDARRRQLVATGFLALGNTNLEEQDKKQLRMDVVDEQLDVIGKGLLAQTITCARCHDHKFDPIPTRDYYAMAGILRNAKAMEHANVSKWIEVPLPLKPDEESRYQQFENALASAQARLAEEKKRLKADGSAASGGPLPVAGVPGIVIDDVQAKKVGVWQGSTHSGTYLGAGYIHDQNSQKGEKTVTFQTELPMSGRYEVRFAYSPGANRAKSVPVTVFSADGEKTTHVDMKQAPPIDGRFISLGEYQFEKNGQSFVIVSTEDTVGHVTADAVVFLSSELRPMTISVKANKPSQTKTSFAVSQLEAEVKRIQKAMAQRPMVLTVVEEAAIEDARVHIRGSVNSLGEAAPRGFLQVASGDSKPAFSARNSGRLELAEWISSSRNPLTARVMVNRIWHWLMGSGLVRTTDNFGTTGERPSHPELLDRLALTFMHDGWSIKRMVRRVVLSQTYRQSTHTSATDDPENRLFGRANRKRLDAESIRDVMLSASGELRLTMGSPGFAQALVSDYGYQSNDRRRSVYLPVFRNALPEIFQVFDFADSSMVTGSRNESTVAQQALFMLNHPFAIEQAAHAGKRLLDNEPQTDTKKIERAYHLTLGRRPTQAEENALARFLQSQAGSEPAAWAAIFQALFASPDFRYLN